MKRETLRQYKGKILEKVRRKGLTTKEDACSVPDTPVKIISNIDVDPLGEWPSIFDKSLLPPFPTDVQRFSIPYILMKENVNVISETGSGKTLSYVLPYGYILENDGGRLLVIVPTIELVSQVSQLFRKHFSEYARIVEISGGKSIDLQRLELSTAFNVVVSTPGRLKELMELKCVGSFDYVVVDEVDRLLSCNFREDMDFILESANPRVSSYFSATPFECFSGTRILVGDLCVNRNIEERFIYLEKFNKFKVLKEVLESPQKTKNGIDVKKIIVFCNTIKTCDYLHKQIELSIVLHSRRSMNERENIVEEMHNQGRILIATDLAGRGIDIKDIDMVINYDFPTSIDTYIHRCGRTGRQRIGISLSMLCEEDRNMFRKLRRLIQDKGGTVPSFLNVKDDFIVD